MHRAALVARAQFGPPTMPEGIPEGIPLHRAARQGRLLRSDLRSSELRAPGSGVRARRASARCRARTATPRSRPPPAAPPAAAPRRPCPPAAPPAAPAAAARRPRPPPPAPQAGGRVRWHSTPPASLGPCVELCHATRRSGVELCLPLLLGVRAGRQGGGRCISWERSGAVPAAAVGGAGGRRRQTGWWLLRRVRAGRCACHCRLTLASGMRAVRMTSRLEMLTPGVACSARQTLRDRTAASAPRCLTLAPLALPPGFTRRTNHLAASDRSKGRVGAAPCLPVEERGHGGALVLGVEDAVGRRRHAQHHQVQV